MAKSILSSSNKLLPTEYPWDFKKVNAIPPPIIIVSTFSIKFSITVILSETFAPPKIATKGLSGLERAFPIIEISFSTKNPTADGKNLQRPAFEQCALWLVPKASLIYTSPSSANSLENSSIFLVSSALNLVFSNKTTSPSFRFKTSFLTFSSTTISLCKNLTSLFKRVDNSLATGSKENSFLASPFGLPKWDNKITFALFSIKYFIVGKAATILALSVIFPISVFDMGTLKSTLTITLFELTSKSVITFLFIITPYYTIWGENLHLISSICILFWKIN